jgi:hypothetical protein
VGQVGEVTVEDGPIFVIGDLCRFLAGQGDVLGGPGRVPSDLV